MRRNIVYQFKTLYVRNVAEDLIKKKKIVAIFVCICAIFFAGLGIRQGNKKIELSEEQQQELDDYNLKLAEYDSVIADVEKGISEADKQIEELQEYNDESIYMQIDPQNIQTVAVQYSLSTGGNVGNIINTFISFINDGALKEGLPEKDQDLKVKYWRDIVSCYQSGNTLNIVVVHSDMDSAKRIMSIIKERVQNYIPKVKERQGDFSLDEVKTSAYVKADSGMTDKQNGHRNDLRNYTNTRVDFKNKLISNQNSKKAYIEKNEPEFNVDVVVNKKVILIKYVLLGIIFGIVIMNSKKEELKQESNITMKDLPLKVEAIPISFNIVNTAEGNILECTYKNNSNEDISRLTIQVKFKGTEEIVTLSCNEVVEAGNESVKFTGKGPASGNIDDVQILKYKISTANGTYMEYDSELNQYNWS